MKKREDNKKSYKKKSDKNYKIKKRKRKLT